MRGGTKVTTKVTHIPASACAHEFTGRRKTQALATASLPERKKDPRSVGLAPESSSQKARTPRNSGVSKIAPADHCTIKNADIHNMLRADTGRAFRHWAEHTQSNSRHFRRLAPPLHPEQHHTRLDRCTRLKTHKQTFEMATPQQPCRVQKYMYKNATRAHEQN